MQISTIAQNDNTNDDDDDNNDNNKININNNNNNMGDKWLLHFGVKFQSIKL